MIFDFVKIHTGGMKYSLFIGHKLAWMIGLIVLLAGGVPQRVQAQETLRYDVVLQGVPLEEALRQLLTKTDLNLAFDQSLVTDKWVYCVAEQSMAEEALRCVLKGTGLDFYRLSSGLYVLTELPEARPLVGNLQGIVVDSETGEPLPNAHVLLADGSLGTVSNEAGRFLFADLEPGYYRLTTSYLGYRNRIDSVWVEPETTAQTRLSLDIEAFTVTPIVVDAMQWRVPSDTLGKTVLSREALLRVPNSGLADISRSLNALVGIRLSDATADLHVQGSETGEHQFRLDGAPVFIPVSIGGLVGPFSPFALGRVTVHKTGFGAEVGSQSAGVIQAEHALGQDGPQTLDVQVDPMSVNARLGFEAGTPGQTATSFLLAGRTGLWDLYAPSAVRGMLEDWNRTDPFMFSAFRAIPQQDINTTPFFRRGFSTGDPGLGFLDTHAALRKQFGPLRSLHASAYWGRRRLDSEQDLFDVAVTPQNRLDIVLRDTEPDTRDRYVWNNVTAQMRYEAVLNGRMMMSLRGRASLYRLRHDIVVSAPVQSAVLANAALEPLIDLRDDNGNRIHEYAVEARLDYAALDRWSLEAGIEPTYTLSRFLVHGTRQAPIAHASGGWRLAGFLTNRFTLSRRLTLDAGSRFTYLTAQQKMYAEPRLALRYDHPGGALGPWSARLATGLYRQFVNQFDVSSRSARALLATSRMWLGVDDTISPPHTAHLGGEMGFRPATGWTVRLEGYYKQHLHLLAVDYAAPTQQRVIPQTGGTDAFNDAEASANFLAGDLPIPSQPQSSFLADGEGYAYGGAALVEKKWHRLRLEARYEYSRSERSFGSFYNGNTITTPWNEPHRIELAFDLAPTDGLTILGRWHSIWGRTWGFRQSYYDFLGAYRERLLAVARSNTTPEETDFDVLSIHDIINHIVAYQLQHPEDHQLPALHQLDLSLAYTHKLGATTAQIRLDLLNVFDYNNVADWRFAFDPEIYRRRQLLIREERHLLPFTPSLALRLAW